VLKFHPLQVADVQPETEYAVRVRFSIPNDLKDAYRFAQGQHVNLRASVDGKTLRRSYSICSAIDEPGLFITVKKQPHGQFSTYLNEQIKPGDELEVMTPNGHFHTQLDPQHEKTYVAFAAGSGITPVISNIKSILAREPRSRCVLFYGNRSAAEVLLKEDLEELKDRYLDRLSLHFVLSREQQELPLYSGHLDADKCQALCQAFADPGEIDEAFICGPDTMIDELSTALVELGVDREHVHFERFAARLRRDAKPALKAAAPTRTDETQVTLIMDGRRSSFAVPAGSDDNLVEAALKQGIDLPFSCRGGVCATCRARLVEGDVDMALNYALEDWELEQGFILACQSVPRTDTIVLDYDAL
jgi:ring-1,2-phenylacetyl-CoA epoxidase subunit PaaE